MAFPGDNFGTSGNDGYIGSAHASLYGLDGDDRLVNTFFGNNNNVWYGGRGDDIILDADFTTFTGTGTVGNPFLFTGFVLGDTSSATVSGDEGRDILYGAAGDDTVLGGAGDDSGIVLSSFNGAYYYAGLYGGSGNDVLVGGGGDDYLDGESENDTLFGGAGNDTIYGGAGADRIYADGDVDTVFGGTGNDSIIRGAYFDTTERMIAEGNAGDDFIVAGDNSNDVLYGDDAANTQTGNDFIWGGRGTDYIYGGQGNDNLVGYHGSDYVYGGSGNDFFNLYYDVNNGDVDYFFDVTVGQDYILLPKWNQNDVFFFESGGYGFGYIQGAGSSYYLFGAAGLTTAQMVAVTLFV